MKSAEEEDPSVETLSVVEGEPQPPNSKTSPEESPQQRCASLSSTRRTGSGVKVPLSSNFTQDCRMEDSDLGYLLVFVRGFTFLSTKYIYLISVLPPQTIL